MKIDEACINHNTVRVIGEILQSPIEYNDADATSDHTRLVILGEIHGVLLLADAMKEALGG
jgi:hypothetical protein